MPAGTAQLPKLLAPGVFWLGSCDRLRAGDTELHSYNSVYLVCGNSASLVVDTALPKDWSVLDRQLDEVLASGVAPVKYLYPTHCEAAHSSNLARLLEKFPDADVRGDIRDYHLIFPEYESRLSGSSIGEVLDLGCREIVCLKAVFKDMVTSRWAFDRASKTLFTGDGFAYMHYHDTGHCGKWAEELPDLPVAELTAVFADAAFYWTRFADIEPIIQEVRALLERLDVRFIAPGHGCPIRDVRETAPKVYDGLRLGQLYNRELVSGGSDGAVS